MTISLKNLKSIQLSFLFLLAFTLFAHTTSPYATAVLRLLAAHFCLSLSLSACAIIVLLSHLLNRPKPVYLLNYSCYKPPTHQKCSYPVAESFVMRNPHFSEKSLDFMRKIYKKSGLGDETYAPPYIFQEGNAPPSLNFAMQEAEEGMFSSIDALFSKTSIEHSMIDIVVVTGGGFSPAPSHSAKIVNHYRLRPDVKTYNLSGMGCGAGVLATDMAVRVLQGSRKVQNALVVITENITMNWYSGDDRSMLVTNCIFRVGCTAAIVTNDPSRRRFSKMQVLTSLRTHHGADDRSYRAGFQEEDDSGFTGISLTKDLVRVAGVNLTQHLTILGPRVLPLSQLVSFGYRAAVALFSRGNSKAKLVVPDFTAAFEHMCIHTGGKAVIEQVGRVLGLSEEVTEPARMSLNRFGNTSSSLVFYELAYFEAKRRLKKGNKMWMIGFGTGFKIGSLVWKCLENSGQLEDDNPWNDCINRYPLKAWQILV